jgi:hypothetical protein
VTLIALAATVWAIFGPTAGEVTVGLAAIMLLTNGRLMGSRRLNRLLIRLLVFGACIAAMWAVVWMIQAVMASDRYRFLQ